MKSRSVILFLIFYMLNLLVLGMNQMHEPFYAALSIAIPFDNGAVIFSRLIFNYALIMIFTLNIIRNIQQLLSMSAYILPRTSRRQMFWIIIGRTLNNTFWIVLIKLLADLFAGQLDGLKNVDLLITLYMSLIFTLMIWILFVLILFTLNIGERVTIFAILSITFMCQYLSINIKFLNIFVVASPSILTEFAKWGVLKVTTILALVLISYSLFKNKEFIGDEKD